MKPRQYLLDIHREIMVDLFAGGGGMSKAFYLALGRHPDVAVNHNEDALSMHQINHPQTQHYVADVFEVDPRMVCKNRPVGHLHASPDCTHHSQAAGGQPRNEKRRALSWVVVRWAGQVSPRVITLENVKQVQQWGPLIAKRDKETGRVLTLDKVLDIDSGKLVNRIAEPGERVPRENQFLVPDPKRAGKTWKRFKQLLKNLGYEVETQNLVAADFGAGTTRDRLFMHARNDGKPIKFPQPTHFKNPKRGQKKWSAAHEHINFSIESKSIFERSKPLAHATMRRIAKGMMKFVVNNPDPFVIQTSNSSANGSLVHSIKEPFRTFTTAPDRAIVEPVIVQVTQSSNEGLRSAKDPLPTMTTAKGGEFAIMSPVLVQAGHGDGSGDTKRWGSGVKSVEEPIGTIVASGGGHALAVAHLQQFYGDKKPSGNDRSSGLNSPLPTITTENRHALVTAFLAQANGGFYDGPGRPVTEPVSTITNTGSQQQLITANLVELRNNQFGSGMDEPISTIMTSGSHHALVEYELDPHDEVIEKALRVSAFIMSYYGTDNFSGIDAPVPTITTKDRLALVTVIYKGTPHYIVDIKFRMLEPPELYSATGFGDDYIITHGHDGRTFTKAKQTKMVGNAVSPIQGAAMIAACHEGEELRLVA